jgi:hypothetical protein
MEEDDGDTPGFTGNSSGSRSGQAALSLKQRKQLESKHSKQLSHRKEGGKKLRHHKHSPRKEKWRYACRPFGMNSLKGGAR